MKTPTAVISVKVEGERNYPLTQLRLLPHDFEGFEEVAALLSKKNPDDSLAAAVRQIFKAGIAALLLPAQSKPRVRD